ncbi:MAG: hypothetical protein JOZ75_12275 [Candidatus Dormibacteraeota bacterium]|nr:hypothetical protein [Candidatus Dormibacteraeota bacterium]
MSDYASRTAAVLRVSNATRELSPDAQRIALQGVETAGDPLQLASAVEAAAPAAAALDPSAQSLALAAATGLGSPDAMTSNRLWTIIVIGLLALLATSLLGLIVLLALGKTVDVIVTAFTALLTGTLGLFVPSPTANRAGG